MPTFRPPALRSTLKHRASSLGSLTGRLWRGALGAALVALSLSCGEAQSGDTHVVLITEMRLVLGPDGEGHLAGLNVDDSVDTDADTAACGKVDATGPDGTEGVDNQFSVLGSLVLAQLGGDPDALIQSSINDGRLLVILEMLHVDSLENDNDVDVLIHIGSGPVDVGTDGRPEPGQSFDISEMSQQIEVNNARIVDGRIDVGRFDININVDILQAMFVLTLLESRIVLDLQEDGSGTGTLGAGVDAAMVRDIIENDEVLMPTLGAATLALRSLADLEPNESGGCDRVSVGIEVDVQPAFILRQP